VYRVTRQSDAFLQLSGGDATIVWWILSLRRTSIGKQSLEIAGFENSISIKAPATIQPDHSQLGHNKIGHSERGVASTDGPVSKPAWLAVVWKQPRHHDAKRDEQCGTGRHAGNENTHEELRGY